MKLNDAVMDNIFNFDGAEFRIVIERNGNVEAEYIGNPGYAIDFNDAYAALMDDSDIASTISDPDCVENLRTILREIVRCCEDCDLDWLVENLDKMFRSDSDGTVYQFFVDIFNVDINF